MNIFSRDIAGEFCQTELLFKVVVCLVQKFKPQIPFASHEIKSWTQIWVLRRFILKQINKVKFVTSKVGVEILNLIRSELQPVRAPFTFSSFLSCHTY